MSRARELSRVGSLTGISTITGVIHADQTNNRFKVGSAVTMNSDDGDIVTLGIITATSFVGDGSGITNAGSTLSAGSGSQRIVLTSQTSGAMTATSTDSGLTYESGADALTVSGGLSVGAAATVGGNLTVTGNLQVDGTTTTVNSTTLTVDDKNIELASTASPSDATADGGGITLKGTTDHTWNWVNATDAWTSSEHINIVSGKVYRVNGTEVLSSTQVLGATPGGTSSGDLVTIDGSQTLTNKSISGSQIDSGTVAVARLGSGTPSASNFLRGDGAWTAVPSPNDGTLTLATSGTGLSGSATFTADDADNVTFTVTSNATNANTGSTIVARDASGNFAAQDVQFDSFGVGTAASGTTGEIRATNDITAFFSSDERLKENIVAIPDALAKLEAISGNTFDWREGFGEFHSHEGADCGVIAQEIEALGIPGLVTTRESGYKAVKYEKLTALLIEAVKELSGKVKHLEERCNCGQAHN